MSSIKKHIKAKAPLTKKGAKVSIVLSEYNPEICLPLYESCVSTLKEAGVREKDMVTLKVPGAWEIPFACQLAAKKKPDAIIAFGCLIKGETPHFDYIAKAVSGAIMDLSLRLEVPILFGLLTTLNLTQAKARIRGGKRGDKGIEVAQAAIQMINLS